MAITGVAACWGGGYRIKEGTGAGVCALAGCCAAEEGSGCRGVAVGPSGLGRVRAHKEEDGRRFAETCSVPPAAVPA